MTDYRGCELKIKIPANLQTGKKDKIHQALLERLPSVAVQFISSPDSDGPTVADALVPRTHPLAGMVQQDFGGTEMRAIGAEALHSMAVGVLENLNV